MIIKIDTHFPLKSPIKRRQPIKHFFLFQFRDDITCLRVYTSIEHFASYIFLANAPNYIGSFSLFFYSLCVCVSVSCCVSHCLSLFLIVSYCFLLSLAVTFSFYSICVSSIPFYRPSNAALKIVFFYCSWQYMGNSKGKFDKKLVTLIK